MAINLHLFYPLQVSVHAAYPYGKPRNVAVAGDGTGFPLEENWTSDVLGFFQALLDHRGITPNGTPDRVGASQYLQALLSTFIDGVDGGTYNNANPIILQGDLEVSGTGAQFTAGNHAAFLNGITVGGGTSFFIGNVDVTGEMDCDTLEVDGASSFVGLVFASGGMLVSSGLGVSGGLTVSTGTTTLAGNLEVSGLAAFTGSGISVQAQSSLQQPLVSSNEGRVVSRAALVTDTDMDLSIEAADYYYEQQATLSANRTFTLLDDGAEDGDWIRVRLNNSFSVDFVNESAVPVRGSVSGGSRVVEFLRIGGAWVWWSEVDNDL